VGHKINDEADLKCQSQDATLTMRFDPDYALQNMKETNNPSGKWWSPSLLVLCSILIAFSNGCTAIGRTMISAPQALGDSGKHEMFQAKSVTLFHFHIAQKEPAVPARQISYHSPEHGGTPPVRRQEGLYNNPPNDSRRHSLLDISQNYGTSIPLDGPRPSIRANPS
jgi:hypothetical protein